MYTDFWEQIRQQKSGQSEQQENRQRKSGLSEQNKSRRVFQAERMKYRHTFMNRITFFMPFLTVLLAAALTSNFFSVDSYNWWYTGMYPGYLAVMCSIIRGKDKSKKNYTIWSLPCDMGKIWDAKIVTGMMMSGISVIVIVIMTIVIGNVMKMVLHVEYIAEPDIFKNNFTMCGRGAERFFCLASYRTGRWNLAVFPMYMERKGSEHHVQSSHYKAKLEC